MVDTDPVASSHSAGDLSPIQNPIPNDTSHISPTEGRSQPIRKRSSTLTPKNAAQSVVYMTELLLPHHIHPFGKSVAAGGQILAWMDLCAGMCCKRHCNSQAVTRGMDDIYFHRSIRLGEVAVIRAQVNATFSTSMEIGVRVERQNPMTGEEELACSGFFTFVAIGNNGRATPVRQLLYDSEEAKAVAVHARERRELRLEKRKRRERRQNALADLCTPSDVKEACSGSVPSTCGQGSCVPLPKDLVTSSDTMQAIAHVQEHIMNQLGGTTDQQSSLERLQESSSSSSSSSNNNNDNDYNNTDSTSIDSSTGITTTTTHNGNVGRPAALAPVRICSDTMLEVTQLVLPSDANTQNYTFGGRIIQWMERVATVCAIRHARRDIVTVGVDNLHFFSTSKVGDAIILKCVMNCAFGSSMEVGVRVEAENLMTGERRRVGCGYVTLVALDNNQIPCAVPPLLPVTSVDIRRMNDARKRRILRLRQRMMTVDREAALSPPPSAPSSLASSQE